MTKIDQLVADLRHIGGCRDGNCKVIRPVGMHTNGGCKCLRHDPIKAERVVAAYQRYVGYEKLDEARKK